MGAGGVEACVFQVQRVEAVAEAVVVNAAGAEGGGEGGGGLGPQARVVAEEEGGEEGAGVGEEGVEQRGSKGLIFEVCVGGGLV